MPIVEKYVIKDWKRLWQMVSGIHHETPRALVREELMSVCSELQAGVLQFKPKSASDVQLEALLRDKKQEKLLSFTERLQDLLNIESAQCWEILCYYLTQEYRGSSSLLTQLISTETSMAKLLADIGHYYSLERMIVLKIVKNLILFYNVPNHPYHQEYREVVDKLTLTRLRDSYLDQLESLIDEQPPRKLTAGECFYSTDSLKAWSERNSREVKEVLHILLLMTEHLPLGLAQIKRLFSVFKQHSFGRTHKGLDESNAYHQALRQSLTYSEMALLLRCLDFENPRENSELIEQLVGSLDGDITSMYHRQEHGPLLLFWMLVRLRGTNDAEDASSLLRCRHLGKRAVELKCFVELHSIVTHPMFSDDSLLSRIVRKTIYNQVGYMCDLFDGDGSCARYEGIYELLYELLSWPQLAKDFCSREDNGTRSLYTTLLENFPLDFTNLAKLGQALTKGGQRNYIKKQLEALPILALMYDEREHKLNQVDTDDFELTASFRPYPRIDLTIPVGTSCTAVQHPTGCYMHFRAQVNFFDALHHEMNCLMQETGNLHGDFATNDRIRRVEAGLKFLECAVQCTQSVEGISAEMVHPTEMCIDLLNKFKTVQCPPVGLLSTCLNVCTALLPLVEEEIFTRVSNLGILPSISEGSVADYKLYASGSAACFQARFLGCIIDNVEKKLERYDFLLAYLAFLRTHTKLKRNRYMQVELPGLIFVLRDVFPHVHAWHFRSHQDKNKIYFEILSYICDILDLISTGSTPRSEDRELLLKVCIYSLLNLENGMILLRFVGMGNCYLQNSMELETNWMQQQPQGLMMLVRLSMRILMQLLRLKGTVYGHGDHESISPLEALIYTQPKQRDTLRIIPTVCSYMSNIFDRWLPILSCRLLKRIALEFNMSLLACLDMEPDQIRLTFIQKLPDELESDSIKVAILELVDACIAKQPGVTEAFFKVNYGDDKCSRSFFGKDFQPTIGESIVTYMREFLDALEQEPLTIKQVLPQKIMNIFHSLWKQNLQMLVNDLLKRPKFWQQLCSPLLCQFEPNIRVYTQVLNIVSMEVYTCNGKNDALKEVLSKFFEIKHFDQWLNYVFDLPKEPAVVSGSSDELPDWICCLQAFKDLIVIMLKKQPKLMSIPEPQFKLMAKKCLTVLVDRSRYLEDMRPFIILAELYVFILLKLNHSYTNSDKEDRELMGQMLQLMSSICSCYEDLHVRAKEACLAIITKSAHLYTSLLIRDSSISLGFLNSVVSIICTELQSMENSVSLDRRQSVEFSTADSTGSTTNSLILCLNLLKTVATIFHSEGPGNWDLPFVSVRLFQRLLRCIGHTLPLHSKQVLTVHLLDVLIVFAKSHCSVEFLHCDIGECLWLRLQPPRELVQAKYEFNKPTADAESWTPEHWWPVYARGIELVNIIYDKHKGCFLKTALQFVGIHEVYLVDAMLLSKQSLEPAAMQLIKATVSLVASLTENHKEWAQEHKTSLMNIMRAMQSLLCHISTLFYQQRNLKCLLAGRHCQLEILRGTAAIVIDDDLISACNDLTDIIIYCTKSLLKFSPDLMELICSSVYEAYKWSPLLDVKFGAPKLSEENVTLTFSMILNLVSIYVKALNMQNHGFSEVPLNSLPNVSQEGGEPADNDSASLLQTNRTFSKTISSTSIVSASCPASELLSNMDSHLCLLALEHLLMFVASQGIYIIRSADVEPRWKQVVRRDISNDLLCFHEFVRRKVIPDSRDSRSPWLRRKHGLFKLSFLDPTRSSSSPSSRSTDVVRRTGSGPAKELRVNVVRRLHLQQQHRTPTAGPNNFDMTRDLSPIVAARGPAAAQPLATSSTPRLSMEHGNTNDSSRKRLYPGEIYQPDELAPLEVQYFPPPTEHGFCEQSQVQLVEEDYLKLMSLLFVVIPASE